MKSILSSILRIKYYHFKAMIVDPRNEMRRNTSAVLNRKADENLEIGTLARRKMKTAQLNRQKAEQRSKQGARRSKNKIKLQNTQCEDNKKAIRKGQGKDILKALGSQTHA